MRLHYYIFKLYIERTNDRTKDCVTQFNVDNNDRGARIINKYKKMATFIVLITFDKWPGTSFENFNSMNLKQRAIVR